MNKEEFKAKAKQKINEVSAKVNELKAKKESVKEEAKSKYSESIKDLEAKKTELESKYKDLENTSEENWDKAKDAFSSVSNSLKEGLNKISSMLSIVIILFFLAACSSAVKEGKATAEDLKEEASEVVEVSENYTEEQWEKLNAEIDENMQDARYEYNELNTQLKAFYKLNKSQIEIDLKQLESKVQKLNNAAADEKEELEAEVNQLQTALNESLTTFRKKMADETNEEK